MIVIAPDKFKGSLTAPQVAEAIAAGLRDVDPKVQLDLCPMADGGEGTVDALVRAANGRFLTKRVTGPLPEMKVDATFGLIDDGQTAVIEMAAASGLHLLRPHERDPLATTTFGTGELMRHAIESGATKIILGIGGSATCEAGIGAAQGCGFTIVMNDGSHAALTEPLCGRDLENVLMIKQSRGEITRGVEIVVACDVNNPLYGPHGAACVFAPQKGATPEQVTWLDEQLTAFANRTARDNLAHTPGAGAAGGLGFGMLAFFNAVLRPGVDIVIEATKLSDRLAGAALCVTGEGCLDEQSLSGKTTIGVARLCKSLGVKCVAIVGTSRIALATVEAEGLATVVQLISSGVTADLAMCDAAELVRRAAKQLVQANS